VIGAGIAVVVALVAAVALFAGGGDIGQPPGTAPTTETTLVIVTPNLPEPPTEVTASMSPAGDLTVAFTPVSEPTTETQYRLSMIQGVWPSGDPWINIAETTKLIPGFAPEQDPCFTVSTVEGSIISSPSRDVCARVESVPTPAPDPPGEP